MTEMTFEQKPARRFDFSRLTSVLIRPRHAFEEITAEARATWLTPMLVLTLTSILVVVVAGYFKSRTAMTGEVPLPPDWQYWSPDMQEDYMQAQQTTQSPTVMYVFPMVAALTALWLGWPLVAAMLHLGSTLLGGRGSMQSALNVVAWASLPFALRDILRAVYMLSAGQTINSPGLSGFALSGGFLTQVLARVDLFWIWYLVLLVIGIAIADGLTRNKAIVGVVVVLFLLLAAQAGLGSLTSGGGGEPAQRPFF